MKNISFLLLAIVLFTASVQAQEQPVAAVEPVSPWQHTLLGTLNITQISFTDWAQGGENALAWALAIEGKSTLDNEKLNWANSYKFGFGQTKLGSQGIRKTDDKIDLESVLTYKMGTVINPYVSATLKTQFAEGYAYDATGGKTPISNFFDPAYLMQSAGVGYQPIPELKTRFGAGVREIITSKFTNYSDDPATANEFETLRIEGGLESVIEANVPVMENVVFNSKIELFAPLKTLDVVTVRNDNTLSAKVNKYISVNLNLQVVQEPKVTPRTQMKQTLALGISYSFI